MKKWISLFLLLLALAAGALEVRAQDGDRKNEYEERLLGEREVKLEAAFKELMGLLDSRGATEAKAAWEKAQAAWKKFAAAEAQARAAVSSEGGSVYSTYDLLEWTQLVEARAGALTAVLSKARAPKRGATATEGESAQVKEVLEKERADVKKMTAEIRLFLGKKKAGALEGLKGEFDDSKEGRERLRQEVERTTKVLEVAQEDCAKVLPLWEAFLEAEGTARAAVAGGDAAQERLEAMAMLAKERAAVLRKFHAEVLETYRHY